MKEGGKEAVKGKCKEGFLCKKMGVEVGEEEERGEGD